MHAKLAIAFVVLIAGSAGVSAQGLGACGMGEPSPLWVAACGAIADNPQANMTDRVGALKYRGVFEVRQRDFGQAIKDFSAAIALDSDNAEAFSNRALAYQMSGDLDRALPDYDRALSLNPKFQIAYFNRGNARAARGDKAGAVADFTQAIALKPDFGVAYRSRGLAKQAQGDIDGAIADQTSALQHDANDYDALMVRSALLAGKADYEKAIADLDTAIKLRPNQFDGYSSRGNVRFALGNFGPAADDLARAARVNPRNPYAALWHYLALTRAGNISTAELSNAAHAFEASGWPAPIVAYYLGKADAAAVRLAAQQGDPQVRRGQQCEAEFYLGEFDLAQKHANTAKPQLMRAAEICPPGFIERMGALAELRRMQ
jgi:tetratricopeptide (TPR) repeat protein